MAYIGEEFQKRYKTLPEDIQEALTAVASVDTIFAIGKKHGLMVDQIGKMADEIWKVMLGLANPKDFIRNLASAIGIEFEKASAIASDVNAQMFQLVRESLRRIYDSSTPPAVQKNITPSTKMPPASSSPFAPSSGAYLKGEAQEKKAGVNEIPPLNVRGARGVIERGGGEVISPMIYPHTKEFGVGVYPQDRFEEPQMSDLEGRTKEAPEQLAPLVPVITSPNPILSNPLNPPYPKGGDNEIPPLKVRGGEEELLYPEKTKEVSREPASSAGGPAVGGYKGRPASYAGRDPYRESVEE